jgi:hypothetical protein
MPHTVTDGFAPFTGAETSDPSPEPFPELLLLD